MLPSALDGLSRFRLEWPEALVIDLLADSYAAVRAEKPCRLARQHADFLRELVEGEAHRAAVLRLDLIATCAGAGIELVAIEDAERLVFDELRRTTEARFRNSPRLLSAFIQRIDDANARIASRVAPPSPTRTLLQTAKGALIRRSPLRLSPLPA